MIREALPEQAFVCSNSKTSSNQSRYIKIKFKQFHLNRCLVKQNGHLEVENTRNSFFFLGGLSDVSRSPFFFKLGDQKGQKDRHPNIPRSPDSWERAVLQFSHGFLHVNIDVNCTQNQLIDSDNIVCYRTRIRDL